IGTGFFLTVAACWAVLIPAKCWNSRPGDSAARRGVMMVLGLAIALGLLWLNGWTPHGTVTEPPALAGPTAVFFPGPNGNKGISEAAGYLSYFGLAFFALRWWKMADRHRAHRFS